MKTIELTVEELEFLKDTFETQLFMEDEIRESDQAMGRDITDISKTISTLEGILSKLN